MDTLRRPPERETAPNLPPEAPLDMRAQSFAGPHPRKAVAGASDPTIWRRFVLLASTALLTAFAAWEMYLVLQVAGLTLPERVVLVLFVVLFAWVAFSFIINLIGFLRVLVRKPGEGEASDPDEVDPARPLAADGALRVSGALPADGPLPAAGLQPSPTDEAEPRTALLFPVYNEDVAPVMARLQAMYESLVQKQALAHFDFFILSDTTRPEVRVAEEAAFLALRERVDGHERIFYRHRRPNAGRKAGNIADWVKRYGGRYEHMVVLDADSLMSGQSLVRLVQAMTQQPETGLIQTLPVIVNGSTVFSRLQQFANRLYGPMLGFGLAWWHGAESNYWGHNAIIRTRAFAENAGLPHLPGRKPIGGEIMSHDFVEAALMRRGGWAVRIAPDIGGSYEEAPPALSDFAMRDRRWCQGNLQHMGVLPARGLHPVSRLHLLTGIGAYLTAPLWLLFLLAGILIALQAQYIRPEYFPREFVLFPQWPAQDPVRAAWVFVGTMSLLVLPKLLAWLALLLHSRERRAFGGAMRSFASIVLETLVSGLMAPVMMLNQSVTVLAALAGRDVGWNVQRRDDGALPLSEVARGYAWHTFCGILLGAAAYAVSWPLFLWMTPVILGLLLAIPLVSLTANARLGLGIRRLGLLRVPEETKSPAILARANGLAPVLEQSMPEGDAIARLLSDDELAAAHAAMLETRRRRRGVIDADLVIGLAKLDDAESVDEARRTLSDRELNALLSDPQGFGRLVALAGGRSKRPAG